MSICIESIWEEFSRPLKDFIKSRVNSEQDAEDILQNVFYKIIQSIDQLNDLDKIHVWIYKITRNAIIDYYRAQKFDYSIKELPEDITFESCDGMNMNDEITHCLKTMIQSLPEKYKEAIILTEFYNLTQKEMGEKLGLSESGAKSRVQRARIKLKEMLLNCCHFEVDSLGNIIDYKQKQNS